MQDKYSAVWVSHSSISDFLKCPRLYFLHNMYKDPKSGRKISLINAHMSLGIAVHDVLENLAKYPSSERLERDLRADFETAWDKVSGESGGFRNQDEEETFKMRGKEMINNVIKDPKFLKNKCIKIKQDKMPPNFFLSEEDNIILNGLIDWIEYMPLDDSIHIVDFKTGKNEEEESSLQLPIYLLLCNALQKRKVTKASYWYLESNKIVEKQLPDIEESRAKVLEIAKKIKDTRDKYKKEGEGVFTCPKGAYNKETKTGGCFGCRVYEKIINKDEGVKYLGVGGYGQDMYMEK